MVCVMHTHFVANLGEKRREAGDATFSLLYPRGSQISSSQGLLFYSYEDVAVLFWGPKMPS